MQKPEMILFDFGHTLIGESDFDSLRGNSALFPYVSKNPRNVTPQEFSDKMQAVFHECRAASDGLIEFHEDDYLRYVLTWFGMELRISLEEAEDIIWDNLTDMAPMPGAPEMLARLRADGMRTGVISNLTWSEEALRRRISRHLPEHQFEFIIPTSSFVYRKPGTQIFELACRVADLPPEVIWYCGNDVRNDVIGAHNAGMFPVFHDDHSVPTGVFAANDKLLPTLDFPYLRVEDWYEFIRFWETVK